MFERPLAKCTVCSDTGWMRALLAVATDMCGTQEEMRVKCRYCSTNETTPLVVTRLTNGPKSAE